MPISPIKARLAITGHSLPGSTVPSLRPGPAWGQPSPRDDGGTIKRLGAIQALGGTWHPVKTAIPKPALPAASLARSGATSGAGMEQGRGDAKGADANHNGRALLRYPFPALPDPTP